MDPSARRQADGAILLQDLTPWFLAELLRLPELLHPDQPEKVKRRLFPDASDDDEGIRDEWRRLVHPELFALLGSACEIVEHDLEGIDLGGDLQAGRIVIPAGHAPAWISALNAARLTLSELHDIRDEEMAAAEPGLPVDLGQETTMALARIHLLAWLQEAIILAEHPQP